MLVLYSYSSTVYTALNIVVPVKNCFRKRTYWILEVFSTAIILSCAVVLNKPKTTQENFIKSQHDKDLVIGEEPGVHIYG